MEKPDLAVCLLTLVGQWPLVLLMIAVITKFRLVKMARIGHWWDLLHREASIPEL